MDKLKIYNFNQPTSIGLLIIAGGFEDRAKSFARKIQNKYFETECSLVVRYTNQRDANEPTFLFLKKQLKKITSKRLAIKTIDGENPITGLNELKLELSKIVAVINEKSVLIDISGMPHLLALGIIHYCLAYKLTTKIVYTEAKTYYPLKSEWNRLVDAWRSGNYDITQKYLLSAALKKIHIVPEFAGVFRPNRMTCLIIFAGFEPNRVEGLVDDYAPSRLIVFYGKSPHKEFTWRTNLSKDLHRDLFSRWFVREQTVSTLHISKIEKKLENEYKIVSKEFDIAISPQNSKMQALATYLFWRKHPDVQLLFTSPVRFNPKRYSIGSGATYILEIKN